MSGFDGQPSLQLHISRRQLFVSQGQHIADHGAQILFPQPQFHRPREIHQRLHHAIQPVNLRIDNIQVPCRRCLLWTQLVLQQLKMHHDGVDWILDFMSYTRGQPANRSHAPRKLQFRLDFFHRFKIVQRDQCTQSHSRMVVVNEIH